EAGAAVGPLEVRLLRRDPDAHEHRERAADHFPPSPSLENGTRTSLPPVDTTSWTPSSADSQKRRCSSAGGTSSGRTIRKPTWKPSVNHQMLRGNCGSRSCHAGSERPRAAERVASGSDSQLPPRTTHGKRRSGQSTAVRQSVLSPSRA